MQILPRPFHYLFVFSISLVGVTAANRKNLHKGRKACLLAKMGIMTLYRGKIKYGREVVRIIYTKLPLMLSLKRQQNF